MNSIPSSAQSSLSNYRRIRAFRAESYVTRKSELLSQYFRTHSITTAIVGVSGGVDSAVVLGILKHVQTLGRSPLRRVIAVQLPIPNFAGASNQEAALSRGTELIEKFGSEKVVVELTGTSFALKRSCDQGINLEGRDWAAGQLASYIRTPALYYLTSVLTEAGECAIVCGTTNRDEGAYIGFFGKASDGMVDLQIISDIHKSEVYQVAKILGVPPSIIAATPSGDVFDSRTDEEMIGAPYDFLELYQNLLCDSAAMRSRFFGGLPPLEKKQLNLWASSIERLHRKNLHKYLAGEGAVHLDVYERAVPDGWKGAIEISAEAYAQIRNDPYYRSALPFLKSERGLVQGGFFLENGKHLDWDGWRTELHWYATPLFQIRRSLEQNLDSTKPKVVLITTGAFCPVHAGHLHMMECAKGSLEARGYQVLGGFLSPSHDEYVRRKCGDAALSALHRISLCREALSISDWLSVDTWESLYSGRDVNFTKVVWRLSEYLRIHLKRDDIEVFYVCGGDNAKFALSFLGRGGCVVIPRNEDDPIRMQEILTNPLVRDNPKICMALNSPVFNGASTQVREGRVELMESRSAERWINWQRDCGAANISTTLVLRDEGVDLLRDWQKFSTAESLAQIHSQFVERLLQELSRAFQAALPPDKRSCLKIKLTKLSEQLKVLDSVPHAQRISVDPLFKGEFNIGCSRLFELGASWKLLGLTNRPGWPELNAQMQNIPAGVFTLVDDDIATGTTTDAILSLLPARIKIESIVYLSRIVTEQSSSEPIEEVNDLGDLRDFLPGAFGGGLVVRLNDGSIGRAPYLLPYVQPSLRISIPISSELDYSLAIWESSRNFFAQTKVAFSDCDPSFQALMNSLGVKFTSMEELCSWHIDQFKR